MKQLKIDFTTAGEILPSNYNSLLLSFIKAAVEKYAPQIFDEWFNTAPEKIFKIVQDKRVWVAYRHL